MGFPSGFAFYARDRDGTHRGNDHRKAASIERGRWQLGAVAGLILALCAGAAATAAGTLRVAVFHTELQRDGPGLLLRDIRKGDPQEEAVVRVIRAAGADVLVLGGIDWDLRQEALGALAKAVGGYPYRFALRPNRGRATGLDLDGDGRLGGPGDAEGFGRFAGQEGMAVLSRYPLDASAVRDFSGMAWRNLPGNVAPEGAGGEGPLSTTAHWDLPVAVPGQPALHLLIWHATPPVFGGPQERNARRNRDETALWLRYLESALPEAPPEVFVLAGIANADPVDGDGRHDAILDLLALPEVQDPRPRSVGGRAVADAGHRGDPALDTVDWEDPPAGPGNLRVDYLLPSAGLKVTGAGVLWPPAETSLGRDVAVASRHRLVWVDIRR